jgi:hypothetical protein
MAVAENIRFGYFRYTAQDGSFWSVKADQDYGALAGSGLGAFNAADPLWPKSKRYQLRRASFFDPTTGLKTSRVIGTAAATLGVPGAVLVSVVRGSAGTINYTSQGVIPEKRPKTKTLIAAADTTTT